jgi:hypothetical protein
MLDDLKNSEQTIREIPPTAEEQRETARSLTCLSCRLQQSKWQLQPLQATLLNSKRKAACLLTTRPKQNQFLSTMPAEAKQTSRRETTERSQE